MRLHFFVLLAVVVASSALVGGAVAQEDNSTAGDGAIVDDGPTEYEGHVGGTVHIVSAEVVDGEWVLVLEADSVAQVTVQDPAATMGRLEDSGSGNFNPSKDSRKVTVMPEGQTKVTLQAAEYDGGHALYVLAQGDGWYTSTGMSNDPFRYFGGTSGLMTGMGLAVVCSGGAAWYIIRKQNAPVARAD